ncbi:hypothetical protein FB475_6144 [Kribbella jejuensis]|uniref:Uncharacterized protein n=2 Tax=Kribbella jejuensis TaxID=236068 RepID=A0A542DTS5_9ACTN|nr:hypothetical protein FB475_6144 [Kribbella jejuensis]
MAGSRTQAGLSVSVRMLALADRLLLGQNQQKWAPGLTQASGGWDDDQNRVIILARNDAGENSAWTERVSALHDDRVRLQLFTPKPGVPLVEPLGRLTDHEPWYGGDWLHPRAITAIYNNSICTSGFNWKLWSTGRYLGSTANHCYQGTDIWYHNKQVYGEILDRFPAVDTMLIQDNSNPYAYYAAVWVGPVDTDVSRAVRGIKTSYAVGQLVAFSGSRSGLHTAHITHTRENFQRYPRRCDGWFFRADG